MPVNTITVGPGVLTIGSDTALQNFSGQITSAKVTPNVDKGDPINVLSGETVAGDRTETFTLNGTMLQDFGAAASKTEWLFAQRGVTHPFVYTPSSAAGKSISGSLVVEAIEIGGDVTTKPTSDFEFELVGPPVIGEAAGE